MKTTFEKFQEELKKEPMYNESNLAVQKRDAITFIEIRTTPANSFLFWCNRITGSILVYKFERGYSI